MVTGKLFVLALILPLIMSAMTFERCIEIIQKGSFHIKCVPILTSKILGYSIIAGSIFLKFPQILKIYANKSAAGLSAASFYNEIFNYTLILAYSVHMQQPFSTYGENVFIVIQCLIQTSLLWVYTGASIKHISFIASMYFFLWCVPLFGGLVPENLWVIAPLCSNLINIAVRLPQIMENYKNQATGQLSLITCTLNLAGTIARTFTTYLEVPDVMLLANYVVATLLNLTLVTQIFWYWSNVIGDKKVT